ncbi:MAG: hypothetical protein ACTHVY_03185 [Brevibacterium yomogidense]|uniref:hypothetical protein n=1 Tax=Brevibacterium sp. Mu109 TaxID=1255669 RepID=UPI000C56E55D|nr:hypothetical protein [Brevibacterium sp. Mu109]SMX85970.1 hypothetical protein BSP109_02084 [Brevibacterium sp. Mu109]
MSHSSTPAAAPRARRLTRPRWRDPRLLIGAVLVLVSLVATTTLVRAVAETTRVWAAAENLVPGGELTADSFVPIEVKLPASEGEYISADSHIEPGTTVRAVVGAGELIPVSSLVALSDMSGRVVSVDVSSALPAAVASGSRVDVWATDARAAEVEAPDAILEGVDVLSVDRGGGDFTSPGAARIEVYVPDGRIGEVVRALATGHHISVVVVPDGRSADGADAEPTEVAP